MDASIGSRFTRRLRRLVVCVALVGAAWTALAASAQADLCSIQRTSSTDPGTALFDSQGYYFDVNPGSITGADRNDPFAALEDSGSNGPTGTPPGPRGNSDSYDSWGALFVGPGGDASLSNLYFNIDDNSCTREDGGRELVFPPVNIGGLIVQRKLFVSATGAPGARLLELIHNPGGSAVTTSVQVGDTRSDDDSGDLGSDDQTQVRFDSSGNAVLDPSDLWAVTSDDGGPGYDPALAHVFDGQGGADNIDFATLLDAGGGQDDNLAYRWDNVTIGPGKTAAYLSYEVQQEDAGGISANTYPAARAQALARESQSFGQLYAGMSAAEIAAVRNWPKPATVTPRPPPGPPGGGAGGGVLNDGGGNGGDAGPCGGGGGGTGGLAGGGGGAGGGGCFEVPSVQSLGSGRIRAVAGVATGGTTVQAAAFARRRGGAKRRAGVARASRRWRRVGRTTRRNLAVGRHKITVRLSSKARRQLKRRRRVKVRLRLRMTAPTGKPLVVTRTVTLVRHRGHHRRGRRGG